MKEFFVGERLVVFKYHSPDQDKWGTIVGINKEGKYLKVELDDDNLYYAAFDHKGIAWEVEEDWLEYEDVIKENMMERDDNQFKDFIKTMDVPNVLTKMDYQKLLDAALDRGEFSEAFRLSKKMENL